MPVISRSGDPTKIVPGDLYSLPEFIRCSGLSYGKIRKAARELSIEPPLIKVGRSKFIMGDQAIAYIEQLAACTTTEVQGQA